MFDPIATYRIQFHQGFTFKNLMDIIPYLHSLGVTTIYASPIFEATPGSNHGYDVTDPHRINPEIGTLDEFLEIGKRLKELKISWIQDIVPNHMAFDQHNSWLMDVLEKGQASSYAPFFDILWDIPAFGGKLMVPFLGGSLADAISDEQLSLTFTEGKFRLRYGGQQYPVNARSVKRILSTTQTGQPDDLHLLVLKLKDEPDSIPKEIIELLNSPKDPVKKYIKTLLKEINQNADLLTRIANEQYYQLSYWQDSDRMINYRRFFTVNGLICINIQDESVFNVYHRFIKELLDKGLIQGLRVDHIDGLADPKTYLERLRQLAGDETYIVVEKILESGENFPSDWPVQGSTGYDFLGVVNNLLTSAKSKKSFTDFYHELSGDSKTVASSIPGKKATILYGHMAGELDNLYHLFKSLKLDGNKPGKLNSEVLKETIAEFLIRCPVYRFYGNSFPLNRPEEKAVKKIFSAIETDKPDLKKAAQFFSKLFSNAKKMAEDNAATGKFYQRCMQFTGPLMAKGVEDTLMYTYDRFIAHNEVGDSPEEFGMSTSRFHAYMQKRQERWPLAMNGTSTHDTKRGEDVRARLNVISGIPQQWFEQVKSWQQQLRQFKHHNAPDTNDEYLIYQTLTGLWAFPGQPEDQLPERLQEYLTKALREAKKHTNWAEPDESYENAVLSFVQHSLDNTAFRKSMQQFQQHIANAAVLNSLTQVLLKFTCPGIPDVYQGCELWDLSMVDPDNRRPVDYQLRTELLKNYDNNLEKLWEDRYNGCCKLWLTHHLYRLRHADPELFAYGNYIPLQVHGTYQNNIVAYARQYQRRWIIVAAPLHLAGLETTDLKLFDWKDTRIALPEDAPLQWLSVLAGNSSLLNGEINLVDLFNTFPLGILQSVENDNKRRAGIIMHVTSLPSPYGIGDLGPGARKFTDFLSAANQAYWQMLPVNPTSVATGFSPYSGFSSMAGNTLLISPDDLLNDGLLSEDEIAKITLAENNVVDYKAVSALKDRLFELAYQRFINTPSSLSASYQSFKKKESYWLDDFALYNVVKAHHHGLPWYEWPTPYKHREKQILNEFRHQHEKDLDKTQWLQFIFFRQWNNLKTYSNKSGVSLLGDLPFYVSYDSADVWTQPDLFELDDNKHIAGVAGVPPDYFNAAGQRWGMPVYRWDEHRATVFSWWIKRMKKNVDLFDLIRLDHFRAFYDFWRVPSGEATAINGQWFEGPGAAIFHAFEKELGNLPFIAEDLGDVNEGVYALRDQFKLPGMNVLQFAFGNDLPISIHTPHNHKSHSVTYTGTHDNNTTLGWFDYDTGPAERRNLSEYLRVKVNRKNVTDLLNELCYASVANLAILPMQDVLRLDSASRMNMPSSEEGNWTWRMNEKLLNAEVVSRLKTLVKRYNR